MMMINEISNQVQESSAKKACKFLSEYSSLLLGCGATCVRTEKNVKRIAEALDVEYSIIILDSCVELTVWDRAHEHSYSITRNFPEGSASFNKNTCLSMLSWDLYDGRISFERAEERLKEIYSIPNSDKYAVLVLASVANASFCRLFGGDWISMFLVLIATVVGFRLKQIMSADRIDTKVVFLCSAFVSSVIGAGGYVFNLGATPDIALGTSVLYLVPGIPYLNSMSDLLDGHYMSFAGRFLNATILTICLSAGLCGGFLVMSLKWF